MRRHRDRGTNVHDYYCYGRDILSAADGEVVATESRIADAPFVGFGVTGFLSRTMLGNHVIIRHAENEFGVYAHLVRGSVSVAAGQQVLRGQKIGECGHTGNSSEPHLHFHVQDREDFFTAAGIPVRFQNLLVDGQYETETYIRRGQHVARMPRG